MIHFSWLLLGVMFLGAAVAAPRSHYPTTTALEAALHLSPGVQFPKDVQGADGVIFHTYYEGSESLGNGRYSVIIKLAR